MTTRARNDSRSPVVLVLMGGPDGEHDVSVDSGMAVADALREADVFTVRTAEIWRADTTELARLLEANGAAVVFPVLHGPWGEGGPLQEALEESGVAFVGSRARPAALAMDKDATKRIAIDRGVATPRWALVRDASDPCQLQPPVIVKPVADGSSIDLRICRTDAELAQARRALAGRGRLIIEQYIRGREITVGLVGGTALPLIEITPATEFYDYDAKYARDDTRYTVNPMLPRVIDRRCRTWAEQLYRAMGLRDLARVDFMVDDHSPWLLEVNTMPGFTSHSLLPMAAHAHGWSMPVLCTLLVQTAFERGRALAEVEAQEQRSADR